MTYTVRYLCLNDSSRNIEHSTNDYDQAKHFFWAMVVRLHEAHKKIDTNVWELTLRRNSEDGTKEPSYLYHFSKMG